MKNSDIVTLGKVVLALNKYLPDTEFELLNEYLGVYERLKGKNDKEKQYYREKAKYYREMSKTWRENNKEQHYANQKKYRDKKRAKSETELIANPKC